MFLGTNVNWRTPSVDRELGLNILFESCVFNTTTDLRTWGCCSLNLSKCISECCNHDREYPELFPHAHQISATALTNHKMKSFLDCTIVLITAVLCSASYFEVNVRGESWYSGAALLFDIFACNFPLESKALNWLVCLSFTKLFSDKKLLSLICW